MKALKTRLIKILLFIFLGLVTVFTFVVLMVYQIWFKPNVIVHGQPETSLYIRTNATFDQVKDSLYSHGFILHHRTFEWLAGKKQYPQQVEPGRYILRSGMNNNDLINMLRAGLQTPVQVIVNNIRLKKDLAGKVSRQLETDSLTLLQLLSDSVYLSEYGLDTETSLTMFIPNTYEFYWNTDAKDFFERMNKEYGKFWDMEREKKRIRTGMTRQQVSILASIIEKETLKNDEKARMAGVYMNRLRDAWKLQADPTVVFVVGDFKMTRVLTRHTRIDSPYNTYLYEGLPPGPICVPSIASIDAVLNYEEHDYYYFCAREDFSGYHNYARTYNQHLVNAGKYQRAYQQRKRAEGKSTGS
ncbi:MAG TPA: endolytic transglycosylase MltG [Bacteroidales bacterium]|nr:endolytic transglycosylase MltG [Bacteroidales bacterium]